MTRRGSTVPNHSTYLCSIETYDRRSADADLREISNDEHARLPEGEGGRQSEPCSGCMALAIPSEMRWGKPKAEKGNADTCAVSQTQPPESMPAQFLLKDFVYYKSLQPRVYKDCHKKCNGPRARIAVPYI